jgi:hypothetical protein
MMTAAVGMTMAVAGMTAGMVVAVMTTVTTMMAATRADQADQADQAERVAGRAVKG